MIAVNFPNAGENNFINIPEIKYHPIVKAGPPHPKTSANFCENIMISRIGLVMFKYNPESD